MSLPRRTRNGRRDSLEIRIENRQITSLVIGALVIACIVFAVGVVVGKRLASQPAKASTCTPSDPLAVLDAKEKNRLQEAPAKNESPPAGEPDSYVFESELVRQKSSNEVAAQLENPPPQSKNKTIEKTEKLNHKIDKTKPPQSAVQKTPASKKEEGLTKNTSKTNIATVFDNGSSPSSAKYVLQLAAFPSREDAQQAVSSLNKKDFHPYIEKAEVAGKEVFRLRMGVYSSHKDAQQALTAVKKQTNYQAIILVDKS